jgi:hypothetical protein
MRSELRGRRGSAAPRHSSTKTHQLTAVSSPSRLLQPASLRGCLHGHRSTGLLRARLRPWDADRWRPAGESAQVDRHRTAILDGVASLYRSQDRWGTWRNNPDKSTDTWLSARDDACRSLYESWDEIFAALLFTESDDSLKTGSRREAKGIWLKFGRLETSFMTCFVLNRMNTTNKKLHSVDTQALTATQLYHQPHRNNMREFRYFSQKKGNFCLKYRTTKKIL